MDAAAVRSEASALADLALALVRINRDDTGEASEKAPQDLGHATIRLSIALEDLASAGEAAYAEMDSRFEPTRPPVDELAQERAELALLSAILAGDFALDSFAWAELVRRSDPPRRRKDGWVPLLWPKLMEKLDADPSDPMTSPARYLDVTLDAARDALVAHRDPELWPVVGTGTGGYFNLELVTLDEARLRLALRCLNRITIPYSPYLIETTSRSAYRQKVEAFVEASPILDRTARQNLRTAYRWAGIHSPSLASIAQRIGQLVRIYLGRRRVAGY